MAVANQTRCNTNEPGVFGKVVCDWFLELLVTVFDAITGFDCDCFSSRLLPSSTANQNATDNPAAAKKV